MTIFPAPAVVLMAVGAGRVAKAGLNNQHGNGRELAGRHLLREEAGGSPAQVLAVTRELLVDSVVHGAGASRVVCSGILGIGSITGGRALENGRVLDVRLSNVIPSIVN